MMQCGPRRCGTHRATCDGNVNACDCTRVDEATCTPRVRRKCTHTDCNMHVTLGGGGVRVHHARLVFASGAGGDFETEMALHYSTRTHDTTTHQFFHRPHQCTNEFPTIPNTGSYQCLSASSVDGSTETMFYRETYSELVDLHTRSAIATSTATMANEDRYPRGGR